MKNKKMALKIMALMQQEKGLLLNEETIIIKGEKAILFYLSDSNGRVAAGDLSEHLKVSTARIAAILNSLEQKQYIQRQIDELDKRKVYVFLTEQGKSHLSEKKAHILKTIDKLIDELGAEELYQHILLHNRIKRIIEQEYEKESK